MKCAVYVLNQQYEYLLRLRADAGHIVPMSPKFIEGHMESMVADMSGAEIVAMMGE